MRRFVASSPHFFRPVKRSFLGALAALLLLAVGFPAPLEVPADASAPPNPAKSAWFLLWIQELVSYHTLAIYGVLVLGVALFAVPWLSRQHVETAAWFGRSQRGLAVTFLLVFVGLTLLTAVGLFLRGPDWRFVLPF